MSNSSLTRGAHHIGLTVPDVQKVRGFFVDTLGFEQVAEKPDYPAVFVSDGTTMITLWQAADPETATHFDRKSVIGLHHFALKVDDADAPRSTSRQTEGGEGSRHRVCARVGRWRTDAAHDVRDPRRDPHGTHRSRGLIPRHQGSMVTSKFWSEHHGKRPGRFNIPVS